MEDELARGKDGWAEFIATRCDLGHHVPTRIAALRREIRTEETR